jgi:two-component sensor histidine kinase
MALLIHELATNAAKYGALSSTSGALAISWLVTDKTLRLEWRECGGPPTAPPDERGFGLQLLSRALEQFDGSVEMAFEPTGLVCHMRAVLS